MDNSLSPHFCSRHSVNFLAIFNPLQSRLKIVAERLRQWLLPKGVFWPMSRVKSKVRKMKASDCGMQTVSFPVFCAARIVIAFQKRRFYFLNVPINLLKNTIFDPV